jgi:4-amino-4-deoxy-L-arabinose transferase-like glycosyltransferase
MTTSQAPSEAPAALPTSSKVLCAVYAAISLAALIATWSQNAAYFDNPGGFLVEFLNDSKVTPAGRSLTVDIVLFFLAAAFLMVIEARKHGVRFVWLYIVGGLLIAISVTFPLFLIARELRVGRTETTRLGAVDTVLLALLAVVSVGLTIWVDMG